MIASILMGLVAGARSMTPLAVVAWLAHRRELPNDGSIARPLSSEWVVTGATALAVGEILGDKMHSAPDRIVAPGMAARILTGALAGAALSRRHDQGIAAVLGSAAAVAASYVTFAARVRAMRRYGQRSSGLLEDVAVVGCAFLIADSVRRSTLKNGA